uniref:Plasmodium vivax Vir protein n=1 Tax=Parastrongyloides trichosuri TaxID=131310 RepID=A0A0N4Z1Q0_PARTI
MKFNIPFIIHIIIFFNNIKDILSESTLLEIACKRYPKMNMCKVIDYNKNHRDEDPFSDFEIDKKIVSRKEEGRLISSTEKDDESVEKRHNPFSGESSTFKDSSHTKEEIIEYCKKYNLNFATSCTKKINETDVEIVSFCNSFISHCEGIDYEEKKVDKHSHRHIVTDDEKEFKEFKHFTDEQHRKKKKKLRPCTIDCDVRIFKHCTNECKCDYEYPSVQKFCNPPPMPLFLETCRLWYNRCPKFAQYHYSSQFIYSKASKGKTLPGSTHLASENDGPQG